jgi:hypothetical protein
MYNPKEIEKFPVSVDQEAVKCIPISLTEGICARCAAFCFLYVVMSWTSWGRYLSRSPDKTYTIQQPTHEDVTCLIDYGISVQYFSLLIDMLLPVDIFTWKKNHIFQRGPLRFQIWYDACSDDSIKPTCLTVNVNEVALHGRSIYRTQYAYVHILLSKGMRMYHIH